MSLVPITDHRHDICNSHQRQASRGLSRVQRHILALEHFDPYHSPCCLNKRYLQSAVAEIRHSQAMIPTLNGSDYMWTLDVHLPSQSSCFRCHAVGYDKPVSRQPG